MKKNGRATSNEKRETVGVLAFHGDFAEHMEILKRFNAQGMEVRTLDALKHCDRLIIPGGESTVIARFLWGSGMAKEIQQRVQGETLAVYGTCAGAILLATRATGKNPPRTLSIVDMTIERNAYGEQLQSFHADLVIKGIPKTVRASFIRAPVISEVGKAVHIIASHGGHPVLVQQGKILAGTFHPEVRNETALHKYFLAL